MSRKTSGCIFWNSRIGSDQYWSRTSPGKGREGGVRPRPQVSSVTKGQTSPWVRPLFTFTHSANISQAPTTCQELLSAKNTGLSFLLRVSWSSETERQEINSCKTIYDRNVHRSQDVMCRVGMCFRKQRTETWLVKTNQNKLLAAQQLHQVN